MWDGFTIPIPQDGTNFVIGLGPGGAAHAELTINDTGAYTYKLIGPEAAVGGSEVPDVVTYTVTDAHGNTTSNTLTFAIVDDAPVANAFTAVPRRESQLVNVFASFGGTADQSGADAPATLTGSRLAKARRFRRRNPRSALRTGP